MDREAPGSVTLETILVRWFNEEGRRLASHDAARHALLKWSDWFPGALVSEVTPIRLRAFADSMEEAGLSDSYIRRTFAVGKRALNWAHQEQLLDRVPFVKLGPESDARTRVMSRAEAAWFLRATGQDFPHVQLYVALAFGTAARPSSLLDLQTWQQLDWEGEVIHLNQPGRRQTKKRRPSIPMATFLRPLLANLPPGHVIAFNGQRLKSIRSAIERIRERARQMIRDHAVVEIRHLWRSGDMEAARQILTQAKAAGDAMRSVTAYTIRHTVATEARGRGVQPWELSGFLGHSTGYRTTEMYAKNRPEHLRGVVQAMEAYWAELHERLEMERRLAREIPFFNPERRASCVLPGHGLKGAKPLRYLVEPNGIEPLTSTMPL